MRYERLVIHAGADSFPIVLHPRLTVIAGVSSLERELLVGELLGALGSAHAGVHLELVHDDGRRVAVFRPRGGRHRVVDVDTAADVSDQYRTADGRIDLAAWAGVDPAHLRGLMRVRPTDLRLGSDHDVDRLATIAPEVLWEAAHELRESDAFLQAEAEAVGSAPEDAALVEEVERRHAALEAEQARWSRSRLRAALATAAAAVTGVPLSLAERGAALPLLAVVAGAFVVTVLCRRRVERAAAAEQRALADVGVASYLGFHIQRVDGLLEDASARQRLLAAADASRRASDRWHELTTGVPVEWVEVHREQIEAAARVARHLSLMGDAVTGGVEHEGAPATDVARALAARLAALRRVGTRGEAFPALLDEPFADVDATGRPSLLELLSQSRDAPQLVLLTGDDEVASWARLEALTGSLTVIEPRPAVASGAA